MGLFDAIEIPKPLCFVSDVNWLSAGFALVSVLLTGYLVWVWDYGRELQYRRSRKSNLPPGCLGFPLVGETLHLIHSLRSSNPQQFYNERVRKFGHVFKTRLVGHRTVVVTGPTGNRLLLSNENKLFVASWPSSLTKLTGKNSLISKSGDEYRYLRAGIMVFLNPEALQRHVGKMSLAIRLNLCADKHDDQPVKVVQLMKRLVVSVVSSLFFNLEEKHAQEQLCDILEAIILGTVSLPLSLPGTQYRRAEIARSKLDEIISSLVQKRRIIHQSSSSAPDLLSILMAYKDQSGNPLRHCEILDNISFLLQAGFDTTVSVLTMMLKMLSTHQPCFQQLVKEQMEIYHSKSEGEELTWDDTRKMRYTWQVAQETMRLFPPVLGSFRKAIADVEYGGYSIPKGWK
ncbi:hypothetical protein KI387_009333, partial [Taxus chinensis]